MKFRVIGLALCVGLFTITGCKKKGGLFCYKSTGEVKTEKHDLDGFDEISLSTKADVEIIQGAEYSVELRASENILSGVKINVRGDVLNIGLKKGKCIKSKEDLNVMITIPELRGVSVSGNGYIVIPNKMHTSDLDIDISGRGGIRADSLYNEKLSVGISGSGNLVLSSLDTSSFSNIKISGSGEMDLLSMPVLESSVSISGSGKCDLHVIDNLNVGVSGSGDLRYVGNPQINRSITGSGSVRPY